jgi:hypothetical protein
MTDHVAMFGGSALPLFISQRRTCTFAFSSSVWPMATKFHRLSYLKDFSHS